MYCSCCRRLHYGGRSLGERTFPISVWSHRLLCWRLGIIFEHNYVAIAILISVLGITLYNVCAPLFHSIPSCLLFSACVHIYSYYIHMCDLQFSDSYTGPYETEHLVVPAASTEERTKDYHQSNILLQYNCSNARCLVCCTYNSFMLHTCISASGDLRSLLQHCNVLYCYPSPLHCVTVTDRSTLP